MRMKTILTLAGMAFAALLAGTGGAAAAEEATATADVNMRTGPGTNYSAVAVIPNGSYVIIHGCDESYRWCDTSWRDERGWVYGDYLATLNASAREPVYSYERDRRAPVVTYGFGYYSGYGHRYRCWYDCSGLYNPLESYRNEYGSSYYYQHR